MMIVLRVTDTYHLTTISDGYILSITNFNPHYNADIVFKSHLTNICPSFGNNLYLKVPRYAFYDEDQHSLKYSIDVSNGLSMP